VSRLSGKALKALFDYQRFFNDPALRTLTDETARRFLQNEAESRPLPDEAIDGLCGAGNGRSAVVCPVCGAVLPDGEALRRHTAELHTPQNP